MRVAHLVLVAAVIAGARSFQTDPNAEARLAAGRRAIGDGAAIASVRSLAFHGHARVLIGSTGKLSDPRPLEIRILLPDHYLRIVTDTSFESRFGFAGNRLLNGIRALRPGDSFGATWGPEQLGIERTWLARFLLGMLARTTDPTHQMRTVSASSVAISGADGFAAIVDFDEATRMPRRVLHEGNVHFPVPGSTMPPPPQKAEVIWTFDEHRNVAGLRLAHHVVRAARGVTLEEMRFDRIAVNPLLGGNDFEK